MKNNNIDILSKSECTGCSVCYHICPHNAINMIESEKGFYNPSIDKEKCTNCGICVKQCHALNDNFNTEYEQEIYDVRANDYIRMKSSSGGVFTLISNYILENNGYVCGASFTNDWLEVEHIIINDKKDLDKLRKSKYIESNLNNTFLEIKKLLKEKKKVLFTGCPCQVSALNFYLNKKYDNLITIDILCNSVPAQKIWKKYLKELFNDEDIRNIEYISFRDKSKFGWNIDHKIYIKLKNGEYLVKGLESIYLKLFFNHISIKDQCITCKYRNYKRVGDITIGDYWSVENNDNKGVSLVLINTEKGKSTFNNIKKDCIYKDITEYKKTKYEQLNWALYGKIKKSENRKYFFQNIDNKSLNDIYDKYDVGLIGLWFVSNYGAVLTYYALYKLLKKFNLSILVIDSMENSCNVDWCINGFAREFASKYYNDIELLDEKTNDKCSTFITASDQLWNIYTMEKQGIVTNLEKYRYFLDFVDNDKKKIAIATSYGDDNDNLIDNENTKKRLLINHYLSQFDYLSVREKECANFINENLNLKAEFILDPVFLIDKTEYIKLIENTENKILEKDYILAYYYKVEHIEATNNIANKLNKKIIYTTFKESPEEWLSLVNNASFIITDGFHGICFSVIFNKPFVCIRDDYYSSQLYRIKTILELLNISERLISDTKILESNIYNFLYLDFNEINKKLNLEIERSLKWIKNALDSEKILKKNSYKNDLLNLLISENKKLINITNNIYSNIDKISNGIYSDMDKISNGIYSDINKISNGIYSDIDKISNGIYSDMDKISNGIYSDMDKISNGIYSDINKISNGIYSDIDKISNGIYSDIDKISNFIHIRINTITNFEIKYLQNLKL
ncbi:polysaccharide pyruvyl transferase family protein [Brachyspira hampsonii]|uniref:polysaccharide pyruvyl transferase family protein n=1 Tax=Brachyspira hampsonii TaxID=1287055 RepID=UPI000AC99910|nr:polysaccharide pyruvyl transferase family protein [Brachyspira hampsonii]